MRETAAQMLSHPLHAPFEEIDLIRVLPRKCTAVRPTQSRVKSVLLRYIYPAGHKLLHLSGGFWQGPEREGAAQVLPCVPCPLRRQMAPHARRLSALPRSRPLKQCTFSHIVSDTRALCGVTYEPPDSV